ncbi:capsular polysaccharide biosynthesis protein [Acinetobacter faecalis]|uniref:capsular polysaccharide biosynthesis protein n=1 Tax=Acinetobacter faecalis TaxID=2665161 RepID=UPI002A917EC3|nr:capsular polysaccharide biosynthesis protein [Acinetobacter faecalis]MDY6510368.1 capsular polysaccharide biosynthesis protein [Acinetobacter faecalis]
MQVKFFVFRSLREKFNLKDSITLGWGRKKSFFKAKSYAEKRGLQFVCLEDGFIRSLGLGKDGYSPLSIVVDNTGIYFDAFQSSDLEKLIILAEDQTQNIRARCCINYIVQNKITKYNQRFQIIDSNKFTDDKEHILIVDQTFGDQSIQYANATIETFSQMLHQALMNHPNAIIWVKIHPDVLAGKAKAHFSAVDLRHPNIKLITEVYNPIELLQYMTHVYVVSSQLGFEALLCGKKVHCFGLPWYAGWGLTDDQYTSIDIIKNRRTVKRSLEHVFASAYFNYAKYVNPIEKKLCEVEELLTVLEPNVRMQRCIPASISAYGFSHWKRKFIKEFLNFPYTKIKFYAWKKPKKNTTVIAWGKKAHKLKQQGYKNVITVEDGFIRSIGLGAKLIRPYSLVFDDIGIYYDATKPSRLENLLQQRIELTVQERKRAQYLRHLLVDLNITKYNVGARQELQRPKGYDKVLLVVGQVEDDMSIQLGGVKIKTNLSLLQCVRKNNPDCYIIFKPHPDVQAGLRIGKIPENIVFEYANHLELESSILECFNICDELHTITSLSGFEALLRGIKVYCYGLPFYAGWGLTIDLERCTRRTKKLDLDCLIFVTLIQYAIYNIPGSKKADLPLYSPEGLIGYLQHQLVSGQKKSPTLWKELFNKVRSLKNR